MDKNRLEQLLDSVYELEGLIHLVMGREDSPERLPELIARKGEAVARAAAEICGSVKTADSEAAYEEAASEETASEEIAESEEAEISGEADLEVEADAAEAKTETVGETAVAEAEAESGEEDEEEIAGETAAAEIEAEVGGEEEPADAPTEEAALVAALENEAGEEQASDEKEIEAIADEEAEAESETIDEIVEEMAKESLKRPAEPRGRLVFTVNDRFRFKRELFGNSDADFNNTLALVASMENYDEAEDYFLGELQWNPKREEVAAFLEILKKYFKE